MLSKSVEKELNKQIKFEADSSQIYLAMASWAETQGFNGTVNFLYEHSDEERGHMLKLIKYINDRGGCAIIPALEKPTASYESLEQMFQTLMDHEIMVTGTINQMVSLCLKEKDYSTHNFLQWYVAEQLEEESLAKKIMDLLKMIGNDKGGLYLFDRDIEGLTVSSANDQVSQ